MNLLSETIDILIKVGKKTSDVKWIGSKNYGYFYWDHFATIANVEYDDGYGAVEVASDLIVVGDNWWLERTNYDGSEWWSYKTFPSQPDNEIKPNKLTYRYERSLRDMNE